MRKFLVIVSGLVFLGVGACSGDDDSSGRFEAVSRWECYEDSAFGECDCYGLGPNDSLAVGGSNISPTDACTGYSVCVTYRDDFGDPFCSCGADGYEPPQDSTEVEPADGCPPE